MRSALACLLLAALLAGCSTEGRLARRAADYYSFMAGHTRGAMVSDFYNPAYRKFLGPDGVKQHNAALIPGAKEGVRYPRAGTGDIALQVEGRFALTTANPALGDVYANQQPTRWVRVGMRWYLYNRSAEETAAYGEFPVGLPPPRFTPEEQ